MRLRKLGMIDGFAASYEHLNGIPIEIKTIFDKSSNHFNWCNSFEFQDGTQCRCGDNFGVYGQNMGCSSSCPGAQTENCGGATSQHVFAINGGFSNWDIGQPNNDQGYQTCAVMDGNNNFRWNDVECYQQYPAVCKLSKISLLDINWI